MSDVAKGSSRVGAVMSRLANAGYRCAKISASGQRKGSRRAERGIDGDVIALAPEHSGWPHLILEVGGLKKSVTASMKEIHEHALPPGFVAVVVRLVDSRRKVWRWSLSRTEAYDTLLDLLTALQSNGHPLVTVACEDRA